MKVAIDLPLELRRFENSTKYVKISFELNSLVEQLNGLLFGTLGGNLRRTRGGHERI